MKSTILASEFTESRTPWIWHGQGVARIGSDAHRDLFCHMLLDTFDPYKPAVIPWPTLDPGALLRLKSLPFWDIAVRTEGETAMRMQLASDNAEDRLVREAIALNAFEERRHKEVLSNMIRFYGIAIEPEPDYPIPDDPEWAYMQTGYGECIDSFFAFGLFRLAVIAQQIYYRFHHGQTTNPTFRDLHLAVGALGQRAERLLRRG